MFKYKIYGRMSCPFCVRAIALCREQGVSHEFLPLTKEMQDFAASQRHYTVPVIVKGSKFVGGYDELHKELKVHNWYQKIWWWVVTGFHFFHCKQTYRTRTNARAACVANKVPQYLSGKGK